MILFPDDNVDNIPSPCKHRYLLSPCTEYLANLGVTDYEPTDNNGAGSGVEDCAVFLRREMPPAARRELDLMFQDELRDMEVALRPRIEQLMVNLQSRLLRSFGEGESGGDPGEPDEPQEQEQEPEPEPLGEVNQDLVSPESRAGASSSQDAEYDATAATDVATFEQGAPLPEFNFTESDDVAQQEGLWDWDWDPSASGSAVTLFPSEAFFDISFEKLLDPTFACGETEIGGTDVA